MEGLYESSDRRTVYADGAVERNGQSSLFYLTVDLTDLPNGDCACDVSFAEVTNDPTFEWEQSRIVLPPN